MTQVKTSSSTFRESSEFWIVKSAAGEMSRRDTPERLVREKLQQHMREGA